MKKRFTYIFSIDILLAIISLVLFFITKGWVIIPMTLIIFLWAYGIIYVPRRYKSNLPSFNDKTFSSVFDFIGIFGMLYTALTDNHLLVVHIIALICLLLILVFSIYGLVFIQKNKSQT